MAHNWRAVSPVVGVEIRHYQKGTRYLTPSQILWRLLINATVGVRWGSRDPQHAHSVLPRVPRAMYLHSLLPQRGIA
jgi:hypothetical protein